MREEEWEGVAGRRRPWAAIAAMLGLVVLGGLLARPAPAPSAPSGELRVGEDPTPVPEPVPEPVQREAGPRDVAVVHALNTALLGTRVPPLHVALDGRRLRSAVTTRGLQRLVLGLESPDSGDAALQVRDASTLRLVADLGVHPGPLAHLQLGLDAEAVVWLAPARDGIGSTLHRVELLQMTGARERHRAGRRQAVELPSELTSIHEVQALRDGRVAVAAAERASRRLRVLVYDLNGGEGEPLIHDAAVEGVRGGPGPPLVWHVDWSLLHVASRRDDRLTTVDLTTGEVAVSRGEERTGPPPTGRIERSAQLLLLLDSPTVLVTGTRHRRVEPAGVDLIEVEPLEPLAFAAQGGPPELRWRGEAAFGNLVAAGTDRAVLARQRDGAPPSARLTVVTVDPDRGLTATGHPIELDGHLLDVELDASRPNLTAVRAVDGATLVSRHRYEEPGGRAIERRFAAGATVHLAALVVIERG